MARTFVLPDLGEGLVEAEIVRVLVREGEVIAEDAPLLLVETDKATVEIPSPFSGRVERIHVGPNQTVHVGDALVTFADGDGAVARGCCDHTGSGSAVYAAVGEGDGRGFARGAGKRGRGARDGRRYSRGGGGAAWDAVCANGNDTAR